ncbi:MAG: hypothetical protein J6R01_08130 [Alistipes sp.]|nr:hypothetical protein [Alistipes sp.]
MAADGSVIIETGLSTDGFEKGAERLERVCSRLVSTLEKLANRLDSSFDNALGSVGRSGQHAAASVSKAASDASNAVRKIGTASGGESVNRMSSAVQKLNPRLGTLSKQSGKASKLLGRLQKSTKRGRLSLLRMIATSLLMGTVFRAINAVTKGFGESLNSLTQYSSEVNQDVSSVVSALKTLSNSLATAFAPILSVVAPILTTFINLLTRAVNAIGMFLAALTGKRVFTKAVAVQQDYAASLGNTASAAKAAKKELDNLTGLDEINKWQSTTSGGGGGGGAGAGELLPEEMFKTVAIPSKFEKLVAIFKDAWKNADFTEIGSIVGSKIGDALNKIPWNTIKPGAEKTARVTATFINGFFSTPGLFESVGNTVAQALNTALGTAGTFVKTVDWSSIGSAITTTLSSTLENLDFGNISSGIYALATGIVVFFTGALQGVDWSGIPSAILSSINEYASGIKPEDLQELASAIGEALGTAIKSGIDLRMAFNKVIGEGIAKGIIGFRNYFIEHVAAEMEGLDEDAGILDVGAAFIKGIWNGITDALEGVGSWIESNVLSPFVNGFRSAFGIKSEESETMRKEGRKLMRGVNSGAESEISNTQAVFNKTKTTITTTLDSTRASVAEKASLIYAKIKDAWENTKAKTVAVFTTIKTAVINAFNSLKTAIKTPINGIIGFLNSMISGLVNGINSAIRALNRINVSVPSWIPGIGGKRFGFNISTISAARIPYLASGAVIPPNAQFTAVLGDQRHGNNLEAPESLIRQIVREESGSGSYNIRATANGRTIFDLVIDEGKKQQMRTGKNPFAFA